MPPGMDPRRADSLGRFGALCDEDTNLPALVGLLAATRYVPDCLSVPPHRTVTTFTAELETLRETPAGQLRADLKPLAPNGRSAGTDPCSLLSPATPPSGRRRTVGPRLPEEPIFVSYPRVGSHASINTPLLVMLIEDLVSYTRVLAGGERPFAEAARRDLMRRNVKRARDFAAVQNHDQIRDDGPQRKPLSSIAPAILIHGTALGP